MNSAESDYKRLFLVFYRVLSFCEGNNEEEDVEILFQSARILEDTCRELENIRATESFQDKLREFCELKGLKYVPLQFFRKASHHILSRYIVDSTFSDFKVNMAIHQFITYRSEQEFHELAQKLAATHQTVETLSRTLFSAENLDRYKAEQYLDVLRKILIKDTSNVEEIYFETVKSISNDNTLFKIFLKVLCLASDSDIVMNIQDIIALSLSNLLRDDNNISLYSHLFDLDVEDFNCVVTKWHYFIEAFLQTLRISAERLHCDYSGNSYVWTNRGVNPCLSFDQIVTLISLCKYLPEMNDKMKEFLQKIGEEGFGMLAEDIIQKCQIR